MDNTIKNGAGAAAMIAAGGGSLALGIFVILAEVSPAAKTFMTLYPPAGPLSGKTTFAVVLWLLAWAIFHVMLRDKEISLRVAVVVSFILIGLGFLGTFPPFFLLFE